MEAGFWSNARRRPDSVAAIDERGRAVTAGELLSASNRISNRLRDTGIGPGAVVAAALPADVDLLAIMLATRQIGLYLLPINPWANVRELHHLLADSSPRMLIADPTKARRELAETASSLGLAVTWTNAGSDIQQRLSPLLDGSPDSTPSHRTSGDILSYTSGTTGLPRAVLRELRPLPPELALTPLVDWYCRSFRLNAENPGTFLSACPFFYSGPLSFTTYSLHLGRTVVVLPKWNARAALSLISQHSVSEIFMVPYQLRELLAAYRQRRERYCVDSLKLIIHGSAHCPPDLKDMALDTFGDIVYESYGSTEVAGTIAAPADARRFRGTVGRAVSPHEVKILDDQGAPCCAGRNGRVFMRMLPGMEFSYRGAPEATQASQLSGFATAGDLGFLNEEGFLFINGRSSETINCRGEKIHPEAIERIAAAHPQVLDAVVFGTPDEEQGQVVNLAISMTPESASPATVAESVLAHLKLHIAGAAVPQLVLVVKSVPRESSGKMRRGAVMAVMREDVLFETSSMPSSRRIP